MQKFKIQLDVAIKGFRDGNGDLAKITPAKLTKVIKKMVNDFSHFAGSEPDINGGSAKVLGITCKEID